MARLQAPKEGLSQTVVPFSSLKLGDGPQGPRLLGTRAGVENLSLTEEAQQDGGAQAAAGPMSIPGQAGTDTEGGRVSCECQSQGPGWAGAAV